MTSPSLEKCRRLCAELGVPLERDGGKVRVQALGPLWYRPLDMASKLQDEKSRRWAERSSLPGQWLAS